MMNNVFFVPPEAQPRIGFRVPQTTAEELSTPIQESSLDDSSEEQGSGESWSVPPFPQVPKVKISQIFDLKGSLLKRFVTEEEISRGETVLKDLNFCRHHHGTDNKGNAVPLRGRSCNHLNFGPARWPVLIANIMNDVQWLRDHNIM